MSCNSKNNVLGSNRLSSRVDNFVLNHSSAPVDFPGTTDLLEAVTQPDDQQSLDASSYTDKKVIDLSASVDDNTSAITQEVTTRADADSALAQDITTLDTKVTDNYVTLVTANSTYASQDMVYGKSSLNIDVNGYTVGYEVFNGTGGDYIKFKTSTFMLVDPSSGTETTPFYYDSGKFKFSGDVRIDGNLVVTGSITGNKLGNNTIGNGQMATNSINARTIVAGTITASLIAANTITANEIASNYVYAGTISANQIFAGASGSHEGTNYSMMIDYENPDVGSLWVGGYANFMSTTNFWHDTYFAGGSNLTMMGGTIKADYFKAYTSSSNTVFFNNITVFDGGADHSEFTGDVEVLGTLRLKSGAGLYDVGVKADGTLYLIGY